METVVCPNCGAADVRVWENKRRQLVGKCKSCKKVVSFGRDKDSKEAGDKKAAEEKIATAAKPAAKPAPRTARAKAKPAGDGKSGGRGPARGNREHVPAEKPAGSGIAKALKWLVG
jgi:hypothetical protein